MNYLQGPNDSQLAAITGELGEDADRMQHNLQLLQKWMSCQPHLPEDYDNNMLSVFLRGCKHNLERTKRKLETYFIARTRVPELFGNREVTPELMERYTNMIKIALLPKLTPDGHRVTIYKIMDSSADEWDTKDVFRYAYITADIRVAEEQAIAGDIFIYDLEHLQIGHVIKYITPLVKKAFTAANEAYPQRLKQLHFVNLSPIAEKILSFSRSLLKEKIRERFLSHSSVDGLLKYLPKDMLPVEYAGTCGKFNDIVDEWTSCILQHKKWLLQQDNVKAIEPIPEHVLHCQSNDINGVQGSFRQLGID